MPPSRSRGNSSNECVAALDPTWVSRFVPKDVAGALDEMQTSIRNGRIQQARAAGQTSSIPLSLTAADLIVQGRISEGAESVVYRGQYKDMDVAAKKFKISSSNDLWRFRKELLLLSAFNHPHIVPLLGAKALPPDYTLVLPLHSDNLHHKLYQQGWRPTWSEVIRIAIELTSAVCHIHEKGVVHRDIKPGNLLMTSSGAIQLADFGTAELQAFLMDVAEDTTGKYKLGHKPSGGFHKKLVVGTLEYMAPEVLLKEAQTPAADVYAVAVTINELVTGLYPYSDCNKDNPDCHTVLEMGYNRQELASAVVGAGLRPIVPKQCPPGFRDLMDACWKLNPSDRPTAQAVLAGLQQLEASLAGWQHNHLSVKQPGLPHSMSMLSVSSWTLSTGVDAQPIHKSTSMAFSSDESAAAYTSAAYKEDDVSTSDSVDTCSMPDIDAFSRSSSEQSIVDMVPTSSSTGACCHVHLTEHHLNCLCATSSPMPSARAESSGEDVVMEDSTHQPSTSYLPEQVRASVERYLKCLSSSRDCTHRTEVSADVFDTAGVREKMEDRSLIHSSFAGLEDAHLFGVFDGHRGHAAADFVVKNLSSTLGTSLASTSQALSHSSTDSVLSCSPSSLPVASSSPSLAAQAVRTAFQQSFVGLDQEFAAEQEREWRQRVERMGLYAAGRRPYPGCTALATLLLGNTLFTANAGDCRAVLARGDKAVQLNSEHSANCPQERERITKAGGMLRQARDGWRVGESQIQVTRSIGDFDEKQGGVTAVPEVTQMELTEEDDFIIIGSDGLWEHISNEEAVGMVRDTVKEPYMSGKRLATEAMVRGSKDNITAMVIFLRPVSTLERVFADGVATHKFTATEYSSR